MPDLFDDRSSSLESPAIQATEVTASYSVDLDTSARGLVLGNGGGLQTATVGGSNVNLHSVPVGVLPIRVARVHATGTTAADVVAVW